MPTDNEKRAGASPQSIDEIRKAAEQRAVELAQMADTPDKSANNGKVHSKFVIECLYANALGDGMLYCELHKERFVMNKTTGEWLIFNGQHWERDILDQATASVEDVAGRYLDEAKKLVDRIDDAIKKQDPDKKNRLKKTRSCRLTLKS